MFVQTCISYLFLFAFIGILIGFVFLEVPVVNKSLRLFCDWLECLGLSLIPHLGARFACKAVVDIRLGRCDL